MVNFWERVPSFEISQHNRIVEEYQDPRRDEHMPAGGHGEVRPYDHFIPQNGVQEYRRLLEGRRIA